jgi:hypothetical protein
LRTEGATVKKSRRKLKIVTEVCRTRQVGYEGEGPKRKYHNKEIVILLPTKAVSVFEGRLTYISIISLFFAWTIVVIPNSLVLIITSSISPSPNFNGTYVIYSLTLLIPSLSTITGSSSAKILSDG